MATPVDLELPQTPTKENVETYNICFGGYQGVGKTTLYHKLKTGEFVEEGAGEKTDQGLDYASLVQEIEGTTIRISLWDTANLEKFKSMTQSYFRNVNAIILVCKTSSQSTLTALTDWLGWVKDYSREQVVVSLWRHNREDELDDSGDEQDTITDQLVSEFGLTHNISPRMQFEVNAKADDSNVETAFHNVVEFLHKKHQLLAGSPSPGHTSSFKLPEAQRVSDFKTTTEALTRSTNGEAVEQVDAATTRSSQSRSSSKTCFC